jgi:hypothetical protein
MLEMEILAEALERTGRRYRHCTPEVDSWMTTLAYEIREALKRRDEQLLTVAAAAVRQALPMRPVLPFQPGAWARGCDMIEGPCSCGAWHSES